MRQLGTLGAGLAGLVALVALAPGTALAGAGTAQAGTLGEVTFIDGADGPPTAGEEREIRFSLLRRGVAPIEYGRVDLTITNAATDEELMVPATHLGDGIWAAAVTFPVEGNWRIKIGHEWFATSVPTVIAVRPVDGMSWLPAVLAVAALAGAASLVVAGMRFLGSRPAPSGQAVRAEG